MSVINRMLTDLERRGGHTAVGAPDLQPAARPRRWRRPTSRLVTVVLAVALTAVASVLWLQRGPAVADQLRVAMQEPGDHAPAEVVAYQPDPTGEAAEPAVDESTALAPVEDPLQVELAALRFETENDRAVTLVLEFAGEPPPVSLPRVDDGTVALRFAASADGVAVPSPPGDQALFRGLSIRSVEGGGELRAQLAEGTRVGLEPGDNASLRLAARGENQAATEASVAPVAVIEPKSEDAAAADGGDVTDQADDSPAAAGSESAPAERDANAEAPATADNAESAVELEPIQVSEAASGSVRTDDRASDEVLARRRYSDARDALAAGDTRRARRLLEQSVDLDPDLHSARDVLVALLRRAGDDAGARAQLATGLERAPARASFAKLYARMQVDAGEYADARDVLEAARINAEGELDFHALLANVHRRLGDHTAAITEYTEALDIDASQASLWLGLGISLAADGHDRQAKAAFREARETGQLSERLDRWAEQKIEDLERSGGGA